MKTIKLLFAVIVAIALLSCKKDNNERETAYESKPNGKYLSELGILTTSNNIVDTIRHANIEYNAKRFVEKINFYDQESQMIRKYLIFSYNEIGKLNSLKEYDSKNVLIKEENYIYPTDSNMIKEIYKMKLSGWELSGSNEIIFNSNGLPIKSYFSTGDESIDTIPVIYEYDINDNMITYSWAPASPFNGWHMLYKYDNKINPFHDVGIDIIHSGYPWTKYISYVSPNNLIEQNQNGNPTGYMSEFEYADNIPISENWPPFEFIYIYVEL